MDQYDFVFPDEYKAQHFVERLVHYLKELAIYRVQCTVRVIDGAKKDQRSEIMRIARSSSVTRAILMAEPASYDIDRHVIVKIDEDVILPEACTAQRPLK